MKSNNFAIILLFICLSSFSQNLKIISYNIRFDNPADGENRWDLRKDFLCDQINFYQPDVFGIQEGKLHQLKYMDSILTNYKYIGIGRDASSNQGEFSAVFYNEKKFKIIKQATFWLSDTPDKISKGWDAMFERICTYGLFENIKTKQQFYLFNTHFDHVGKEARTNSASLILSKIKDINVEKLPFILTGDFNSETNSKAYTILSEKLDDTRIVSQSGSFGPPGTFNNFEFHKPVTLLIDYIFTSKSNFDVLKHAVLSDSKNCLYPSDHLPVYTELLIRK